LAPIALILTATTDRIIPPLSDFHDYLVELVMVRSTVRMGRSSCPARKNIIARLTTNGRKRAATAACRTRAFRHWRALRGFIMILSQMPGRLRKSMGEIS
jgi:hypothetical protein